MKFWNCLRWLAAITFLLFLAASWLSVDPSGTAGGGRDAPLHKAPTFTH